MTKRDSEQQSDAEPPIRIGISACIVGQEVRFNGGHKLDRFIRDTLGAYVEFVPVCPEVEIGLGVPRETLRLVARPGRTPALRAPKSGLDHTRAMETYAKRHLVDLAKLDLCGFILQKGSPSCGMERVKVYPRLDGGAPKRDGRGLFAQTLTTQMPLMPVEEDGRLNDPLLRENFIERVFAFRRLRALFAGRWTIGELVAFHSNEKLLLMAHSTYRPLGQLVARAKQVERSELKEQYQHLFLTALSRRTTVKKHINVLQHIAGCFRDRMDETSREEVHDLIGAYRDQLVPLIVPITLAIDGNGLYPMHATERVFTTAASFRRHLQKELPAYLADTPKRNALPRLALCPAKVPEKIAKRWHPAIPDDDEIGNLDIDHSVTRAPVRGGYRAARASLLSFLRERLHLYADERNQPEADAQSHLSPYLHFGHVSAHEVFLELMATEDWSPDRLAPTATGSRHGFWGASRNVESFLDELSTWRELGFNKCAHDKGYRSFSALPAWAKQTLSEHATDPRAHVYTLAQFEEAQTHDPLWNAAQRQLVREGTIHNYLRMLWGKKILEWTRSPKTALKVMVELNNKYALDGRDPNSHSGIFWVLGRYDRAWGPSRPIFGKVRYMSSANTARKLRIGSYIERYSA